MNKSNFERIKKFIRENKRSVAILSTLASLLAVVFVIALVMTLSQFNSNSKKIYSTNIEKITVDSNYNWQIEGTTKAPDGAKVIVMASDDDTNTASSVSKSTYAKVQDGKFKATVYLTELAPDEESEEANNKIKAKVVAVTGLDQTLTDDEMPKFVTAAAKETENVTFKVSNSQADYSLSLNDSDEDSSSSYTYSSSYSYSYSSSSSTSSTVTASHDDSYYETGITYEQIARNPKTNMGKPVTFTGKVLQAIEDDGEVEGLRVAVDGDYDQVIYVQIGKTAVPDDSRILEDDLITLRGYACETITYEATSGASITIPAVYALKIDNQGTASSSYGYY